MDVKSVHSSDLSLDEVDGTAQRSDFNLNNPRGASKAEVTAGFGTAPGEDARIHVTRQVLVETREKA
jgi:hypothetical protein